MPPDLDRVITTAGRPATGLATEIRALDVWGTVTIDESVRDDWRALGWSCETRLANTTRRLPPHPQPPAGLSRPADDDRPRHGEQGDMLP